MEDISEIWSSTLRAVAVLVVTRYVAGKSMFTTCRFFEEDYQFYWFLQEKGSGIKIAYNNNCLLVLIPFPHFINEKKGNL